MCASTQALVAGLSDSALLSSGTQAMSDSLLLGSATQAVVGSEGTVTGGGEIVDSMDLLGNNDDNTSSCDTSADDLLMLATQPVFKLPGLPLAVTSSSCSELDSETQPVHREPETV